MTVLVVDDTDSARDVASRILRVDGVEAIGARSGEEVFKTLERIQPDLILLDVSMPDMDGLTVLERIRSEPRWSNIPVVMMTAMADQDSILRAFRLGASEYLVKASFTIPTMLEVVKRYARQPGPANQPTDFLSDC